jgi:hypothetical protein
MVDSAGAYSSIIILISLADQSSLASVARDCTTRHICTARRIKNPAKTGTFNSPNPSAAFAFLAGIDSEKHFDGIDYQICVRLIFQNPMQKLYSIFRTFRLKELISLITPGSLCPVESQPTVYVGFRPVHETLNVNRQIDRQS